MNLLKLVAGTTLGAALIFSGCGTNDDDTPPIEKIIEDVITATVTLAGSIDTTNLASSDRSRVRSARAVATDAFVKLYTLDANGEQVPTEYTCTIDTAGAYSCPAVAPNTEYIVRYVKDLGDRGVLELKTNASVGAADVTDAVVDPISTMVAQAVVQAVKEALVGVTSNATLVESIIKSVKTAVTSTMQTLVQTGVIQVPSLIVNETYASLEGNTSYVSENENLDLATGTVLTDDAVTATIQVTTNEAKADAYSTKTPEQQLTEVFQAIGWDENMPGWVLTMFAGEFTDINTTEWTYDWLATTIKAGYGELNASSLDQNYDKYRWQLENLANQGVLDVNDINGSALTLSAAIFTELTNVDLITKFTDEMTNYYTVKAKTDRNASDLDYLNHFPGVIAEVFPKPLVDDIIASSAIPLDNMAQLFIFMGYMEKVINDITAVAIEADSGITDVRLDHMVLLNEDAGGNLLMEMYGNDQATLNQYNTISLTKMRLQSDVIWDETGGKQGYVRLEYVGVSKLSWDMQMDAPDQNLTGDVNITYPTASGPVTKSLLSSNNGGGVGFELQPWNHNTGEQNLSNAMTGAITGDYTVSAEYNGTIYTVTQHHTVIQGVENLSPKLNSPKEYPQYSQADTNNDGNVSQAEQDAFWTLEQAFWAEGITNYVPNSDDNLSFNGAVFSWDAPDLSGIELPANVQAAYEVSINLNQMDLNGDNNISQDEMDQCNQNRESCNVQIFNTWWDNRPVTTNSITLPMPLEKTTGQNQYNIGVNLMFIDTTTGERVAQGGHTWANFTVAEPTAFRSGEENVTFQGTVSLYSGSATTLATPKIALISEEYAEVAGVWQNTITTIKVVDITGTVAADTNATYSIDVNASVIEANTGNNKHLSVILFDDNNPTNGTFDAWTDTAAGENAYWLHDKWLWIENWGDLRINVDGKDGFNSYKVAPNTDLNITNLDITIW